jgi:hypothetical protein
MAQSEHESSDVQERRQNERRNDKQLSYLSSSCENISRTTVP